MGHEAGYTRVVLWSGLIALVEGVALGVMTWLLYEAIKAQFSFNITEEGPLTLFGLAAMGIGWLNARMISHLWGVGWTAAVPLSAMTLVAAGVGWFVSSLFVTPYSSDCIETLVMTSIVMAGSSLLVLRFEG